jgi:hypothetical protein
LLWCRSPPAKAGPHLRTPGWFDLPGQSIGRARAGRPGEGGAHAELAFTGRKETAGGLGKASHRPRPPRPLARRRCLSETGGGFGLRFGSVGFSVEPVFGALGLRGIRRQRCERPRPAGAPCVRAWDFWHSPSRGTTPQRPTRRPDLRVPALPPAGAAAGLARGAVLGADP